MKTRLQFIMIIIIVMFTGCSTTETNLNSNGNTPIEQQKEPVEEEKASEQTTENDTPSDFTLKIHDAFVTLHSWDNEINLEEILGTPVTQNVEELQNADTYTGSLFKRLEYDGLQMELFSPKGNGESFWIMSMKVTKEGYHTSRGIEVGSNIDEVKNAYPGIEMALDGRTDPNNAAYMMGDETTI